VVIDTCQLSISLVPVITNAFRKTLMNKAFLRSQIFDINMLEY